MQSVVYTYKVTPCFDPQFDPNCPGYATPVPVIYEVDLNDLYDVTKDENVELERLAQLEYEEMEEEVFLKRKNNKKSKKENTDWKRQCLPLIFLLYSLRIKE